MAYILYIGYDWLKILTSNSSKLLTKVLWDKEGLESELLKCVWTFATRGKHLTPLARCKRKENDALVLYVNFLTPLFFYLSLPIIIWFIPLHLLPNYILIACECNYGCFLNCFSYRNISKWCFFIFKNYFWDQHIKTIQNIKKLILKKKIIF